MSRADDYLDRARTALDDLRAQIDDLRVQADLGSAEAKERLQQGIETLRHLQQDARQRVDQAQGATADAWKQIAEQAEKAIDTAGDAFDRLVKDWEGTAGAATSAARAGFDSFRAEWSRRRAEREQILEDT
jgi:chromosome segregation ATPase